MDYKLVTTATLYVNNAPFNLDGEYASWEEFFDFATLNCKGHLMIFDRHFIPINFNNAKDKGNFVFMSNTQALELFKLLATQTDFIEELSEVTSPGLYEFKGSDKYERIPIDDYSN